MRHLSQQKRIEIVTLFVNGNGIRQISRIANVSTNAASNTLLDVGRACEWFLDRIVVKVTCTHLEFDEQHGFIYAKEKNVPFVKRPEPMMGTVWLWLAECEQSRFIISWWLGKRDTSAAQAFVDDVAVRIDKSAVVWITTDLHAPYVEAIEKAFPLQMIHRRTAAPRDDNSPVGALIRRLTGAPPVRKGGTNHVERLNGTVRHFNPRQKRSAYTFSKKAINHRLLMALTIAHYDFCWIPGKLTVTPAMKIGLTDRIWDVRDLVILADQYELLEQEHKESPRPKKA